MNNNIRYLIKVTATSTEDNPNFNYARYTHYYGRNENLLGAASTGIEPPEYMELIPYCVERCGYKNRNTSKAVKHHTSMNRRPSFIDDTCFWSYTVETVAYDLDSKSLITL